MRRQLDDVDEVMFNSLLSGDDGDLSGALCFLGCEDKFDKLGEPSKRSLKDEGLDTMDIDFDKFFGENEYNETMVEGLPTMCASFLDAKQCVDKCGNFPFHDMLYSSFRPLTFMCETHYDEFVKFAPCFDKAERPDECEEKCGDDEFVAEKKMEAESAGDSMNVTALSDNVADLCTFIECNIECMKPSLVEQCGDEAAGELFETFLANMIVSITSVFDTLGSDEPLSPQCAALQTKAGPAQTSVTIRASNDDTSSLMKQKLMLEIKVLNKESAKLELETEVLLLKKAQLMKKEK